MMIARVIKFEQVVQIDDKVEFLGGECNDRANAKWKSGYDFQSGWQCLRELVMHKNWFLAILVPAYLFYCSLFAFIGGDKTFDRSLDQHIATRNRANELLNSDEMFFFLSFFRRGSCFIRFVPTFYSRNFNYSLA